MSNKTQKIPKDRSWKAGKIMMGKVDDFLNNLIFYDKENIPLVCQVAIAPYLKDPNFDPDNIRTKSQAAAGLCSWVINIMEFFKVLSYLLIKYIRSLVYTSDMPQMFIGQKHKSKSK